MPTGNIALQDLGRLTEFDERRMDPGAILWDRFCVVGEQREVEGSTVLTVTDLERKLGRIGDQHRLELHLLPAPHSQRGERRLSRALLVKSRAQPQVFAVGRVGEQLVIACEPVLGRPVDGIRAVEGRPAPLAPKMLVTVAVQLAELLASLHAVDVRGVRFTREMLRVEEAHVSLDRFTHLLGEDDDSRHDIEALIELIHELAGRSDLPLGEPTTALALQQALASVAAPAMAPELPGEPPFVGRTRAMAELARGFNQAQIAQPTAVLLRGHRGVGKSRLMSEFVAARIEADDSIVLTGAWHERSADSRGGLLMALEQLPKALAQLEPDERDDVRRRIIRATRHLGAIVTRSAPSLGSVLRNVEQLPPLELGEDFSRHTAVIADLLRAVGTHKRPLVLALDNLESIDASSAAVLKILTQRSPAHHTLVAMGLRSGTTEPELECESVELAPLSEAELAELVDAALPGEVGGAKSIVRTLWSVSKGLPLVAWTNLREWVERGRLSPGVDDGVWRARGSLVGGGEQLDFAGVFGVRLGETPPGARLLALRIAVFGSELGVDELRSLGPLPEIEVEDAVAELIDRGLLARTTHGVRFPHDSIRELVFEAFDEADRRAAHHHVAELLIRRKAPVAQIAYHRELALDPEASVATFDRLSRLHVDAGSERLTVYDLERARWHLERALEHSRDSEQRGLAAEGLADICLLSNDLDTAVSLYTAIIATADGPHTLRTAAKAVLYLFSKSHNSDARQLGHMALEAVGEPNPSSLLGKLAVTIAALLRSWVGIRPKLSREVREGLCRLYPYMLTISLVDDPRSFPLFIARARWIARGLDSSSSTMVRSFEASMWATFGRYERADKIFSDARELAVASRDHWAHGVVLNNWALASLMPSDRYEEGQDMFDDAIAAFRETGDVSVSILAIMFKGLFGRDREPAERVLGWFDEAIATASRNGKSVATAPLEALRLHVLARQGRTDLEPRITALASQIEREDVSGVDRLMARAHLAFAARETGNWEVAVKQVRAGTREAGELPGVPDFCQEVYLATALVMLERPVPSKADRRLLRMSVRKFRVAAKRAPRLRPLWDLLELKLAIQARDNRQARAIASKLVGEFDSHENLYAAREAHRALSRLLKGENVLAAAEHERVARNLGRRLGLADQAMLSDFTEVDREAGMLALNVDSGLRLDESQHDIPAAGMLSSAVSSEPRRRRPSAHEDDDDDVLAAWALTERAPPAIRLADLLPPVREAVKGSIESLELRCRAPELEVPFESSDLQILIINMLLTSRDAVSGAIRVTATIDLEDIDEDPRAARPNAVRPGSYLTIRVRAKGDGGQVGLISAFSTCEALVAGLGGHLSVATDRAEVTLDAWVPTARGEFERTVDTPRKVVIVHPDPGVRETVAAALSELGAEFRSFEPAVFEPSKLEHATLILADSDSLRAARALEPFLDIRSYELVKRGAEQAMPDRGRCLRVPFELSELEQLLRDP